MSVKIIEITSLCSQAEWYKILLLIDLGFWPYRNIGDLCFSVTLARVARWTWVRTHDSEIFPVAQLFNFIFSVAPNYCQIDCKARNS